MEKTTDEVSAFQLYMSSEFLKTTLNTGAFCYAEEYFVICDKKYVLPSEGVLFHLSECTLDFSYKLVCSRTSNLDVQYMFRSDTEYKMLPSFDSNTQNIDEYNRVLAKAPTDTESDFQTQLQRNRLVNETTSQRMCK